MQYRLTMDCPYWKAGTIITAHGDHNPSAGDWYSSETPAINVPSTYVYHNPDHPNYRQIWLADSIMKPKLGPVKTFDGVYDAQAE